MNEYSLRASGESTPSGNQWPPRKASATYGSEESGARSRRVLRIPLKRSRTQNALLEAVIVSRMSQKSRRI